MRLPHVIPLARDPIYFFTACTADRRPILAGKESFDCLQNIWKQSAEIDGWFVGKFVLMPDHLHLIASPSPDAKSRAQWLKLWRSRFHAASWQKHFKSIRRFGRPIHSITFYEAPNLFLKNGIT